MRSSSIIMIAIWFLLAAYFYKEYKTSEAETLDILDQYEKLLIHTVQVEGRLRDYTQISLKLNDICNMYKSSTEAKLKDDELQNLFQKVN